MIGSDDVTNDTEEDEEDEDEPEDKAAERKSIDIPNDMEEMAEVNMKKITQTKNLSECETRLWSLKANCKSLFHQNAQIYQIPCFI